MTEQVSAPKREDNYCDLCGVDLVSLGWTWITPSTGTLEEAERGEAFWCEDPEWLVCDGCHSLILADNRDALLMRAMILLAPKAKIWLQMNVDTNQMESVDPAPRIRTVHEAFWINKTEFREGY